jgi:hypothetical protein
MPFAHSQTFVDPGAFSVYAFNNNTPAVRINPTVLTIGGIQYGYFLFTYLGAARTIAQSAYTFVVQGRFSLDYLIIGGGGGTGSGPNGVTQGGGGGGLRTGSSLITPGSYQIRVGSKGQSYNNEPVFSPLANGQPSSFIGITAAGGGSGANGTGAGGSGGSGGGGITVGGAGSTGGSGGTGYGSGGGGAAPQNGGNGSPFANPTVGANGGDGRLVTFAGTTEYYAGGAAGFGSGSGDETNGLGSTNFGGAATSYTSGGCVKIIYQLN